MNQEVNERAIRLVKNTLSQTKDGDREAILEWLERLREIRASSASPIVKAQAALRATAHGSVVLPLLKALAPEIQHATTTTKKILWDDRSWAARLGLAGVTVGAIAFGGEGAGIAALGSAVGVPLWLVLGAGGSFLGAMIEELEPGRPLK